MAARVVPGGPGRPLDIGAPRLLARAVSRDPFSTMVTPYDAAPDGQRFLLNAATRAAPASPLTLLAPWPLATLPTAR